MLKHVLYRDLELPCQCLVQQIQELRGGACVCHRRPFRPSGRTRHPCRSITGADRDMVHRGTQQVKRQSDMWSCARARARDAGDIDAVPHQRPPPLAPLPRATQTSRFGAGVQGKGCSPYGAGDGAGHGMPCPYMGCGLLGWIRVEAMFVGSGAVGANLVAF